VSRFPFQPARIQLARGPIEAKINLHWIEKINLQRNETDAVSASQHGVDADTLIKRRKNVATLAKSKPNASADQVQKFERRLREVKQAIAKLPGDEYHEELLQVVRRAGWTTLAEGIFFEALIESILAHTRDIAQLHQRLKAAFEAVQD
jgi:hypothetical protein